MKDSEDTYYSGGEYEQDRFDSDAKYDSDTEEEEKENFDSECEECEEERKDKETTEKQNKIKMDDRTATIDEWMHDLRSTHSSDIYSE